MVLAIIICKIAIISQITLIIRAKKERASRDALSGIFQYE